MEHRSSSGPFFEAVFALLVAELVIIGLLTLPFPGGIRGVIVRWISTSNLLQMCAKPLLYFSVLVVLSFLFTTREMLKLQSDYHELTFGDLAERLQHEAQMFRSQRNFYLTGFCMVQLLVIARIYSLLKQVNKLEATQTALKKQAEGAAAAYKQIQQEKDSSAKASTSGGGAQAAAKEVDDLKKKVADAEAARDAAVKGAEALKKQAEGLSTEYTRLQKEKESLQNKLDDFEMVMGDQVKKAK